MSDLTGAIANVGLSVVAANPGPADGQTGITYGTSTFQVQVGLGPITTVTIQNTAVPVPKTLADLITNLNASLSDGRPGQPGAGPRRAGATSPSRCRAGSPRR